MASKVLVPELITGLGPIGVLVVPEPKLHKPLRSKALQLGVEVLSRLVIVVGVFRSRPVVAVSQSKDGELCLGE